MKYSLLCAMLLLMGCTHAVLGSLYNKSQEEVHATWGEPTTIVLENKRQMWAYKRGECTKIVFFDENGDAKEGQEIGVCQKNE
ncbi:MAG: hypothetical protein II942_05090 [Alphaproteobacteria bacterium]|nr:hypothetical protein [Alphaproteobacteria bacterium]